MHNQADTRSTARKRHTSWMRYIVIALIIEKSIQHIVVTIAFSFNWAAIRSTVVVDPDILSVLGALLAILFLLSLWGMLAQRNWAAPLVIALAICDIIGEFVAQGTITIMITVSFLVATVLLMLMLAYRRRERKRTV